MIDMIDQDISLIGAGYWGKNILRNLYELKVLRTVYDASMSRLLELEIQYPDVDFTRNINDILCDKKTKAVMIATPANTHFEIIIKCLKAGKHVFVEKPLCLNMRQAKSIKKLVDKTGLILMVGHVFQYHPAFITAKRIIESGEIGKIQYIYSNRLGLGKIRTEENALWSLAPHDFSMILSLVKEQPVKIGVHKRFILGQKLFDSCHVDLQFKEGIKGHVFVSWMNPFPERKLVIIGEKKSIVFDDLVEPKLYFSETKPVAIVGGIAAPEKKITPIDYQKSEPLRNECIHFIECVRDGKIPLTDINEAIEIMKLLEKADRK